MTTKKLKKAKDVARNILGHISFGEMLYSYRISWDYSQVDFAQKLHISKQELCNIEKRRKTISVERAKLFAEYLEMSPLMFAKYILEDQLYAAGISGEIFIKEVA